MKKVLLSVILFVMVAVFATTMVNATTGAELPEAIYNKGSKYGVTQGHKVKMERYLARHPITDDQANQVMAKVDEVVAVFENAGVTNMADLSNADLKKIQDISTEAASIVNVKIVWRGSTVDIYYNGKIEETISFSKDMTNTGDETNTVLVVSSVVSSVAVVALAAGLVIRKKIVNA